jgi:hypothetical protein
MSPTRVVGDLALAERTQLFLDPIDRGIDRFGRHGTLAQREAACSQSASRDRSRCGCRPSSPGAAS